VSFLVGLEKNRIVSSQPALYEQVGQAAIPQEGLYTHLKGFGFVQVFRTVSQDGDVRHYALYRPQQDPALPILSLREEFEAARLRHWRVENFFELHQAVLPGREVLRSQHPGRQNAPVLRAEGFPEAGLADEGPLPGLSLRATPGPIPPGPKAIHKSLCVTPIVEKPDKSRKVVIV
jgi:hypothetical protein